MASSDDPSRREREPHGRANVVLAHTDDVVDVALNQRKRQIAERLDLDGIGDPPARPPELLASGLLAAGLFWRVRRRRDND